MTSLTPRSRARRAWLSDRSRRCGCELISSATPLASAASMTFSMLTGRLAAQQHAAGQVADDVDRRMLDRLDHAAPSSRARPAAARNGPRRRRCRAAARQSSARSIEPSARMSHSMPASTVMPFDAASSSARIRSALRQRARLVEAVGHRQRLRVVGDGDVLEAARLARPRPSSRGSRAVRLGRVHVQVAAQVRRVDQRRQRRARRRRRSRRGSRAARAAIHARPSAS